MILNVKVDKMMIACLVDFTYQDFVVHVGLYSMKYFRIPILPKQECDLRLIKFINKKGASNNFFTFFLLIIMELYYLRILHLIEANPPSLTPRSNNVEGSGHRI
jgi:hypothetical protein